MQEMLGDIQRVLGNIQRMLEFPADTLILRWIPPDGADPYFWTQP
jgi:hypothetical protein